MDIVEGELKLPACEVSKCHHLTALGVAERERVVEFPLEVVDEAHEGIGVVHRNWPASAHADALIGQKRPEKMLIGVFCGKGVGTLKQDDGSAGLPEDCIDGRDLAAAFPFGEEADAGVAFCFFSNDRDGRISTSRGNDEDFFEVHGAGKRLVRDCIEEVSDVLLFIKRANADREVLAPHATSVACVVTPDQRVSPLRA